MTFVSFFHIFPGSQFRLLLFYRFLIFKEQLLRYDIARKFIYSLPVIPLIWQVVGSTSRGNFNHSSDIDIFALYNFSIDIPLPDETNDFMFFLDGYFIDYWSFAEDWLVFKLNPSLLLNLRSRYA